MQSESRLDRSLWTIVVTVAAALVIANFAQRPLFGGDGEASGFGHPLTVWVTGTEADSQSRSIARQVAACWGPDGQPVDVGVLPGGSSAAVVDFLQDAHRASDELLLVTSGTLAEIAHQERAAPGSETRERAHLAARLLRHAPEVSVLGSDPLALAVRADSPVRSTAGLLGVLRERDNPPFVGVPEDAWLQGNLAALAQRAGVNGRMPFVAYRSSRLALASLRSGEIGLVLALRSSLASQLDGGGQASLRALPWPAAGGDPRTWVGLLAPRGIATRQLGELRRQATALCPGGEWRRMLHSDGIAPALNRAVAPPRFATHGLVEATELQSLAARIVRNY
ncbi:MAG TPA: hypothetical protein VHU13_07630 [Solirubrobacteraceae bacterium]|jgi:hypothetical protein|nr:hypothetical protein [Solirubrobacteraceae bacterium]